MSYQSKFANDLMKKMDENCFSQATIARLTSVDSGTISRVLSGKKNVSYNTIATIANKLNMWRKSPGEMTRYIEELEIKLNYERHKLMKVTAFNIFLMVILTLVILIK